MLRIVAAGVTALFLTASPLAYAETPSGGAPLSAADWGKLTDLRIDLVKAALKLTPEQEKYWPAVEDAIRTRAKNRQARIADIAKRVAELRGAGQDRPPARARNRQRTRMMPVECWADWAGC